MPVSLPDSSTKGSASEAGPPEAARGLPWTQQRRVSSLPVSLCLLFILLTAAVLRIVNLRNLPAGLFCDEADFGYNAWAILHYGVDKNGVKFPLFLWSFFTYKNPVYLYAATLPIGLLGLNEFSLRLTSAAFGIATVLALFFLGRALSGNRTGLAAAALLAICPWHIQFSRIAFELISFPLLFAIGLLFLIRFTRGERTLPLAFFFFGSCLYAYAIAKLFIPLFLIGFGLLYLPTVWRRCSFPLVRGKQRLPGYRTGEWLIAVAVLIATVAPVVVFDLVHRERTTEYFRDTSIFQPGQTVRELLTVFGKNYLTFFSPRFLFREGDDLVRHAVRGHGELYPFFAPFLVIGLLVLLISRNRTTKLVLLWLALYPVGASLMNEIPSASRGFIGVAAFCLVTGIGVAALLQGLAWIGRRPALAFSLQALSVASLLVVGSIQAAHYFHLYVYDYPKYSAPTYGGFQYGYRDVLATMEPRRSKYPLLMLTATDVNQPQIFPLFYNRVDPRTYVRTGDPGYLIIDPAEYGRYSVQRPILCAVRGSDLRCFSDYTIQKQIVAPGGQLEFVVAEVRARKSFITNWETLGLFANPNGAGVNTNFIDVSTITKRRYDGRNGPAYWRQYTPSVVRTDLNILYLRSGKENTEAPNDVCSYALTVAEVPSPRKVLLELSGSETPLHVWLNGQSLTPAALTLGTEAKYHDVDLREGANTLLIKSCKTSGEWYFLARLVSPDRKDIPDIRYKAAIPEGPPPIASPATAEVQVIEGFEKILSFQHEGNYPDYRGQAPSWWAYRQDDLPEVRWLTAPCPRQLTTTVAFTATVADDPAQAELWVDGQYALTFDMGAKIRRKTWQRGGYRLTFLSKQIVSGNSGVFLLTIPASSAPRGKPLELRVVPLSDSDNPWFVIKGYRDTVRHERLFAAAIPELENPSWKE